MMHHQRARQVFRYRTVQGGVTVEMVIWALPGPSAAGARVEIPVELHPPGGMGMAMNRIEIEVLGSRAALAAFTRAWRQARAGRKTTPRLAFGSIAELFSAVSEKRLELVRHVAGEEGLQIRPLARALGRDYKNVHTDVQALIELGLLEKDERGGLRAPFDEIVIRAGLRKAA